MCWNGVDNRRYLSVLCDLISCGRVHSVTINIQSLFIRMLLQRTVSVGGLTGRIIPPSSMLFIVIWALKDPKPLKELGLHRGLKMRDAETPWNWQN